MKRISILLLESGREPFKEWIEELEVDHPASIRVFIDRLAAGGSRKNVRVLGDVMEIKIDRGPGFRVYIVETKNEIILLTGGDKSTQSRDMAKAKEYWRIYVSK